MVGIMGFPLGVVFHAANIQDWNGAWFALAKLLSDFP